MAACNLVGCMSKYKCGTLKQVVQGTSLAPYVRVYIEGSNFNITVGNQSDPDNGNQAVIKSFQLGGSSGAGVEIEIHDEQGGNFEAFMTKLNKKIGSANTDYRMKIQFGWIDTACGATSGNTVALSKTLIFIPLHVEASFSDGKIKYKLTGTSLLEVVFEARSAIIYGSDENKMSLKSAIRKLFSENAPEVNSVQFYRINSDKTVSEWGFKNKDGGFNGPIQKWETDQQNKLSAAMNWLEKYTTDKDKGVIAIWNPEVEGGEIIFFEDFNPVCGETPDWSSRCLGTYTVNGGSCSPVISFTPTAKWVYSALNFTSGKTGTTSGANLERKGRINCKIGEKGAGNQTSTPFDIGQIDQNGFDAAKEHMDSQTAHDFANKRMYAMEAELRVQGDPSLASTVEWIGKSVSIIVISPFHIEQSGACGDWLAKPGCHPVYSNKAWILKGVDHMIKEGSYVTTLRVMLNAPGSDVDEGSSFGGPGSGGWDD